MTAAITKYRINIGNALFKLNFAACFPSFALFLARIRDKPSVIGIIASVLVSFTIVAESSTIEPVPCIESHVEAAAVTDEVSFTAVPAKRAKPLSVIPRKPPRVGKIRAAITLKRKITEID